MPRTCRYIAILISEATHSDAGPPLYLEDVVLLQAGSQEEAWAKARRRGAEPGHSYRNDNGDLVTWRHVTVVDVAPVLGDDLSADTDLYSRFFRDYGSYRRFEPNLDGESL